jgi:rubrerythrin
VLEPASGPAFGRIPLAEDREVCAPEPVTDAPERRPGMAGDLKPSMEEILRTAIEREADSFDYYHDAAMQTDDPELRQFLLGLAEMEKEHSRRLREELERLENVHWLQSTVTC